MSDCNMAMQDIYTLFIQDDTISDAKKKNLASLYKPASSRLLFLAKLISFGMERQFIKRDTKNQKLDLSSIVANIDKVKEMKAAKQKKPSTSVIPLKFETNPADSPLKAEIIRRINEKNLTYSDIYAYCTKLKNGDISEGQKFGYNTISGLRKRPSMMDTTFSMLCDFLDLDIMLVSRNKEESEELDEE